jgi:hypothetical protein
MPKPITFNIQRLIAAVAAEHRLILKPDDAAFAIVTMNRLVLEESLEAIRAVVAEELAQFKQTAQWAHSRAESAIDSEVRQCAAALREELHRDIQTARLKAAEMVQEVKETYEKPLTTRDVIIMVLATMFVLFFGIVMGRLHAR